MSGAAASPEEDEHRDRVQVFLRLRPTEDESEPDDEACLQVIEDRGVSLFTADDDDPLTYELDHVFSPAALSSHVYASVCADLPERLIDGRDCTVLAYGSQQTGKTHSLFGSLPLEKSDSAADASHEETNVDENEESAGDEEGDDDGDSSSNSDSTDDDGDSSDDDVNEAKDEEVIEEGMAIQLCRQLFQKLEQEDQGAVVESLTIRLSVVEIYLDRLIDLLIPQGAGVTLKENPRGGATLLHGCAAVSCVQPKDAVDAIRRGLQQRTASQFERFRDSHRSTVVVQIRLEQELSSGLSRSSVLQIVDLCASELTEMDGSRSTQELNAQEAAGILALQEEVNKPSPFSASGERPTLARLLLPFCRAETVSRVLLTAAAGDVEACQSTLDFGTACRQLPAVLLPSPVLEQHEQLSEEDAVEREKRMTELVFALSNECQRMAKNTKTSRHGPVWTAIHEIQKLPMQHRPLKFYVETKREHEINAEKFAIRADLRETERKASTQKHLKKQLESDIQILKSQNQQLKQDLEEKSTSLDQEKHEKLKLQQRVKEVEHSLRTSQFRESEAVVFARQFRKFYYRLLRQIHGEDSSPGGSLVKHIAGAPDLVQLMDMDQSMVDSGLMEEDEVGKDMSLSKTYLPSRQALIRSTVAADGASHVASSDTDGDETPVTRDLAGALLLADSHEAPSLGRRHESGEATEARQRIFKTPAGRYLAMREAVLERELLATSERVFKLQNELLEESSTRKDLESKSPAVNKARHAKELRGLKDQLTRKGNDLKAVIFKLNELHTLSKTLQEKVTDREAHVVYLEEELKKMLTNETTLLASQEHRNQEIQQEMTELRKIVEAKAIPIWQLSDSETLPPPITSRISVPFSPMTGWVITKGTDENGRRRSIGETDDWLSRLYTHSGLSSRGAGPVVTNEEFNALRSELEVAKQQLRDAPLRSGSSPGKKNCTPSNKTTWQKRANSTLSESTTVTEKPKPAAVASDAGEDDNSGESDGEEPMSGGIDGLIFMDDDGSDESPVQRRSVYDGLVDAYNAVERTEEASVTEQKEESSSSYQQQPLVVESQQAKSTKDVNQGSGKGGGLGGFMNSWNAKKSHQAAQLDDDEISATPEWMKKFRTIAARNHGESVIETSGSAEARELTRTSFGENHKIALTSEQALKEEESRHFEDPSGSSERDSSSASNDMHDELSVVEESENGNDPDTSPADDGPTTVPPATARPVESRNSLSYSPGSLLSARRSAAAPYSPTKTIPTPSSPVVRASPRNGSYGSPKKSPPNVKRTFSNASPPTKSPPVQATTGAVANSAVVIEEESFDPGRLKNMFAAKAANAKPLVPSGSQFNPSYSSTTKKWTPKKKEEDDSDSDDSFAKSFLKGAATGQAVPVPGPVDSSSVYEIESTTRSASDGEQEDGNDTGSEKEAESSPKEIATLSPGKAKKSTSDDSENGTDSDEDLRTKRSSILPQGLSPKGTPPTATAGATTKSFLDDSDSEMDSDDEIQIRAAPVVVPKPKSEPAAAPASTAVGTKAKSFLDDSESEMDSDDESQIRAVAMLPSRLSPTAKSPQPKSGPSLAKKSFLDDSDSEADSDDESAMMQPLTSLSPEKAALFVGSIHFSPQKHSSLEDSVRFDNSDAWDPVPLSLPAATSVARLGRQDEAGEADEEETEQEDEVEEGDEVDDVQKVEEGDESERTDVSSSAAGIDEDYLGARSNSIDEPPVAQTAMIDSMYDSEGEEEEEDEEEYSEETMEEEEIVEQVMEEGSDHHHHEGVQLAHRSVPDFGAEVASGVPTAPNSAPSKNKGKFVLKDGKLVRQDESEDGAKLKKVKKPKFAIKGGKLVQDDSSVHTSTLGSHGVAGQNGAVRRNSLAAQSDTEDRGMKGKQSRRASVTAMVAAPRTKNKVAGPKSSFVIKDGKLVKNEELKKQQNKQQKVAAFSIMGGKLVKADKSGEKASKKKASASRKSRAKKPF